MIEITWVRNEVQEQAIETMDIPFVVEKVKFSTLDLNASLKNNARMSVASIDDESVYQMAEKLRGGPTVLHMPWIWKHGRKCIISDGNHRAQAIHSVGGNGSLVIEAYRLDTDDQYLIDMATRYLNRVNGIGQTTKEAVDHVIYMLTRYPGRGVQEMSDLWGVKANAVNSTLRHRKLLGELDKRRIDAKNLAKTSILELGKLDQNENVLGQAAAVAVEYDLTVDQVRELVNDTKELKTEEDQLNLLKRRDDEYLKIGPGKRAAAKGKQTDIARLFAARVTTLDHMIDRYPTMEHLQLTSRSEADVIREQMITLIQKLLATFSIQALEVQCDDDA